MHTFASGNAIRQSGRLYGLIPERAAGAPLLAHGKVSCTALRLVHDPAGTGSWVRLRRVGERLGADASSTVGAVELKAATAMHTLAPAVLVRMAPVEIRRRCWPTGPW